MPAAVATAAPMAAPAAAPRADGVVDVTLVLSAVERDPSEVVLIVPPVSGAPGLFASSADAL